MIFKLDKITREITLVSHDEARRALQSYGFRETTINDYLGGVRVISTTVLYFSRDKSRLNDVLEESGLAVTEARS